MSSQRRVRSGELISDRNLVFKFTAGGAENRSLGEQHFLEFEDIDGPGSAVAAGREGRGRARGMTGSPTSGSPA
jgi:hypothetical protein